MSRSEPQPEFSTFDDDRQTDWFLGVCSSPLVWGTALTVAFYAAIPLFPEQREILQRYFCSHWILYAETWLFGIGLAILAGKMLTLPLEYRAFALDPVRNARLSQEADWNRRLGILERNVASLPGHVRRSALLRRYRDVVEHLSSRRNASGLDDHLQSMRNAARERLRESYAFIRTLIWAIPVLGFLGTLIGINIADISPDQLEHAASQVAGGLAVGFDATALSLSLSLALVLVFGSFAIERGEQRVLSLVDVGLTREIMRVFASDLSAVSPLMQAEQVAAAQLLERTEKLINWQTDVWQQSLDGLRTRWEQVVQKQQTEFTRALQAGMESTLSQHHSELAAARDELSESFTRLSTDLLTMVSEVQDRSQQQQFATSQEISSLWEDVQDELRTLRTDQAQQVERLIHALGDEVLSWQTDLKAASHASTGQVRMLHAQGETLLKIAGEEAELSRLQRTLANNLEAVRAVETFEKALHTLTAAVHMLTIKNRAA